MGWDVLLPVSPFRLLASFPYDGPLPRDLASFSSLRLDLIRFGGNLTVFTHKFDILSNPRHSQVRDTPKPEILSSNSLPAYTRTTRGGLTPIANYVR